MAFLCARHGVAVHIELFERPAPIPPAALEEVHDEQVLDLFNLGEAESVGRSERRIQMDALPNIRVPALEQPPAKSDLSAELTKLSAP